MRKIQKGERGRIAYWKPDDSLQKTQAEYYELNISV
jgi:hypothetical protein